MNILKLLDRLSDDKFFTTESTRADSFSQIANFGKKAALAGIPIGLSSMFATSAKAETVSTTLAAAAPSAITEVLQFALTLEYLENANHTFGAKEPWEERFMPNDLGLATDLMIEFLNQNI